MIWGISDSKTDECMDDRRGGNHFYFILKSVVSAEPPFGSTYLVNSSLFRNYLNLGIHLNK